MHCLITIIVRDGALIFICLGTVLIGMVLIQMKKTLL